MCNRNFMRLPKWNTFHPFSLVSNAAHLSIFSLILFWETFGVPPMTPASRTMIPWALADVRSDKLIALKEAFYRQSAPNLTNLFATVAVEQMGRVCDGGVCGVDLSFKRRVDASQFFVQWRPFSDRSPQKPWIEAKVHVEKKFHSPKFPAVHCNPWGFWIQLFSLSGFSKNPKWNLMSHGRRFKEMNQLCSHEFYNLWVEYHEHNPPSLLEQWCMFFGPLFFSAGFPASSIRNAVAGLGFLCGHLLPRCNCPFFYILRIVAKRPWTPPANRYIIRSCGYIHSFPHDQMSPGFKVDLPVKYQKVRGQQVRQREQWFVIGQFVVFPRFNFCWWPQNYTAKLSGFLSNQALLHLQYSYYPVATLDLQLRWWRPGVAETTFS